MALPEQIRKQTEAADEIIRQLNEGKEQADKADVPVILDTPAESAVMADESAAPDSATQQPVVEQTTGDAGSSEETFEHKYRTLQGMYNAEVPRLHQQNREMLQRVQQMEQLLATLSAQPQAAPQGQPMQQSAPVARFVTDEDVADYGDSIEVMRKVSREEASALRAEVDQLKSMLQQVQSVVPQVQAVAQRQAMSADQQFWTNLTAAVPEWREINDDADFQTWLLQVDPLSGINRQTYLDDAQRSLDANRVAQFFRTWLEISGQAVARNTGSAPQAAPAAASELERQVAPGRSKSTGTPAPSKGRIYTRTDITKFFEDVRKGAYVGREQERDRIEQDIFAAQKDGRLQ